MNKYIIAENNLDIAKINFYLSDNPIIFWNMKNPTKNKINNIYYNNQSKYE